MRSSIRLATVTVTAAALVGVSAAAASAGTRGSDGDSLSQFSLQNCLAVQQEAEAEVERSWFSDAEVEQENIFIFPGGFLCNQNNTQVVAPITVVGVGNETEWEVETEVEGEIVELDIAPPLIPISTPASAKAERGISGGLLPALAR